MQEILFSQQTAILNNGSMSDYNNELKGLELDDFNSEKKTVENEIFYLEREIFDFN